ncbi:peptide chain release factor N(5)-glutamine methyltransferase [Asticcacaulis sp. YBE204]|uniref:peptide chain release factor N(5)-glutamine methyltransferase n=1 Tax=Asticcacaulis sp. YBE204 TaxID=1282363 RepID=UPI0003C3EAAD|nr:peptide chain release factor N(5)-glutamine methyltransferase [Asticcacaulis sp. YBE204]ESQ79596.1 N5-glutamine S-adenosyl-L-methionine-dependent methyltransferase [Asticcacaulis sp. YBE204]
MTETTDLTLVKAWNGAQKRLKAAHIDSPAIDARLLLEAATGFTRTDIITDPYKLITPEQNAKLDDYLSRREKRVPVARILGRKGFWKLLLNLSPAVLVPRPETECLVDMILKTTTPDQAFTVADLGVGSGAILLSILSERPAAKGLGTDVSEEALAVARDNAANLGIGNRAAFLRTSWASGLDDESFDYVASNPPYIQSHVIPTLDPEVKDHDPILALDGGESGLDAYIDLVPDLYRILKKGGGAWLEIGYDQSAAVEGLMKKAGFFNVTTFKDLSDQPRIVVGTKIA